MTALSTTNIASWAIASKTKGLKAKHIKTLIVDQSILSHFLVSTLEGEEQLGRDNIICIGENDDAWQQTQAALLKKYNIVSFDSDGWMICEPKPENSVEFVEVTFSMTNEQESFYIVGTWGKESPEGPIQFGRVGDIICRQPHDHTDTWVVKRKLFDNTYQRKDER